MREPTVVYPGRVCWKVFKVDRPTQTVDSFLISQSSHLFTGDIMRFSTFLSLIVALSLHYGAVGAAVISSRQDDTPPEQGVIVSE